MSLINRKYRALLKTLVHKGERERDRERDLINFVGKIRALKRIGGIELKKNGFVVSFFSRSSMICVDLLKKKRGKI